MKLRILLTCVAAFLLFIALLFTTQKVDKIDILYLVGNDTFDTSALNNLQQSLEANIKVTEKKLSQTKYSQLHEYDAIYLDINLTQTTELKESTVNLTRYVHAGGHLYLENDFNQDFPKEFLGASQIVEVPTNTISFTYPVVDENLKGIQKVFQLFTDNFNKHIGLENLPGFSLGKGIIPSTAESIVTLNGISLMTLNRIEKGSVMFNSKFLPNRYFITGFDVDSGMNASQGFQERISSNHSDPSYENGTTYFNRYKFSEKPYFQFAFASANHELRSAYLAFLSKEKYGYSITKVLGPYGRPAMAYQHHYEALSGIKDHDAERWAEFLKSYNQIPSYSLVRGSYDWGQWFETVSVHLNKGSNEKPLFVGEYDNSFYSSGTHIISDGKKLTINKYPIYTDLSNEIELPYRAYPAFVDINNDRRSDLILGSTDGYMYGFMNQGTSNGEYNNKNIPDGLNLPDVFGKPEKILLPSGEPLLSLGYTSISTTDLNEDGALDLLIGDKNGSVMYSLNLGNEKFSGFNSLSAEDHVLSVVSFSAPTRGDIDGDGLLDLVVGDGNGVVSFFRGQSESPYHYESPQEIVQSHGKFAAPAIRDMNDDNLEDLLIGNNWGDIEVYVQKNDNWISSGVINGETFNPSGSNALVGGHNSVPLWFDINHDGKDDLIVGQLEFGNPMSIDDPQFPYLEDLKAFIQYTKDNYLELYPHLLFHSYMSNPQENREIELHKQAFRKLGIPWNQIGTNQHTWRINNNDRLQSLRNESSHGIWFNFGFRPSNTPTDPRAYTDYMWSIPFLLEDPALKESPMVLFSPLPLFNEEEEYATTDIYHSMASQSLPMIYMEHIEYLDKNIDQFKNFVQYFDTLRTEWDYNFMTEPQAARSFLTALTAKVTISQSWGNYFWCRIKDKLGRGKHLKLTLNADLHSVPAQADNYKNTLGVSIKPGKYYLHDPLEVNSDIFMEGKNGELFTALQESTTLQIKWKKKSMHIVRSNVPVSIKKSNEYWTIDLLEQGMQQIEIFSIDPINIIGNELKVDHRPDDHIYTVTHFGDKTSIVLQKLTSTP